MDATTRKPLQIQSISVGTPIANSSDCRVGLRPTMERVTMSTFDNPFDPQRRLNQEGCCCGRHVSQIEHDREAAALQCAAVESEENAMRAWSPPRSCARCFRRTPRAAHS